MISIKVQRYSSGYMLVGQTFEMQARELLRKTPRVETPRAKRMSRACACRSNIPVGTHKAAIYPFFIRAISLPVCLSAYILPLSFHNSHFSLFCHFTGEKQKQKAAASSPSSYENQTVVQTEGSREKTTRTSNGNHCNGEDGHGVRSFRAFLSFITGLLHKREKKKKDNFE